MNKKHLIESLMSVYCRLKPSEHGIGVFAIRDIPINTNPFRDCFAGGFVAVEPKELEWLSEPVMQLVKDFCPLQDGKYYLPRIGLARIDISFYINHSKTPNMREEGEGIDFITMRDIKAGEELTVDYDTYNDKGSI